MIISLNEWNRSMVKPVIMSRVRPPLYMEERAVYADPEKSSIIIPPGEEYHYDKVFGEKATSGEIFGAIQEHISLDRDCTILCYGSTGAGKSTTMMGLLSMITEIIPQNTQLEFFASEIYNNKTSCLVSNRPISPSDAPVYIRQAMNKRSTASTLANNQSSRSHLFISFRFPHKNASLTFVDLAGSERLSQTGNDPTRKQEAIHVNKSLSALRDVVECLGTKKTYVPWRNSTLTQELRKILRSPEGTLIVMLCLSHNRQQSVDTLRFGRRATKMNKCKVPEVVVPQEEEAIQENTPDQRLVDEYKQKYEEAQKELEAVRDALAHSRKRPRCTTCGEEGHNKRTCRRIANYPHPEDESK